MPDQMVLICPKNDEESLQILRIAEAFSIPTMVSQQPHGAKLAQEKQLLARILDCNPQAQEVVIVEIPGPKEEAMLTAQGMLVHVIDHHRYDGLDRMKQESSLEQFLSFFEISDQDLHEAGFDAKMVRAVGAIDRGFLWELKNESLTEDERKQAIAYYRELAVEVGGQRREEEEEQAAIAWNNRRMEGNILIIESEPSHISVRDALSFMVAEAYPEHPPETIIRQGDRRIYVQESDRAADLYHAFGGFTFGRDKCWGKLRETEDALPSVETVLTYLQ